MWNLLQELVELTVLTFSTPEYESVISGVILFDETIRQTMDDGTPIPEYLASRGIHPGIKIDTGAKVAHHSGEKVTKDWTD